VDDPKQPEEGRFNRQSWPQGLSVLCFALLLVVPLAGQTPAQFPSNSGKFGQHAQDTEGPFGDHDLTTAQKRLSGLNAVRQKSIVSDTAKLLKLAQELNKEVEGSDSPTLTNDQMRKIAEIGKLAKSVKEKMSYTIGNGPEMHGTVGGVFP
jgi:hypothetical protein